MKSKTTLLTQICQIALITEMLLSTSMLSAQSMQDTVIANFSLLEKIPHEKVYLHLDKPFYGAGEKIWFKGYLINAITHQDDSQSNFIITELINRSDSIVERKKIRRDSLGFHNAFTLPPTLPAGDYYLRGYSNWMLNEGPEFFYSRNLKIGNSIDTPSFQTSNINKRTIPIIQQKSSLPAIPKRFLRTQQSGIGLS